MILSGTHIKDLVDRFYEDICKDQFLEVVLNPCLRDKKVIDLFIEKLRNDSLRLHRKFHIMIVKQTKLKSTGLKTRSMTKEFFFSRLDFLYLFEELSPLLIVFRHDTLVRFILKTLKTTLSADTYLPAICCNGAMDFYKMFQKRKVSKFLIEKNAFFILFILRLFFIIMNWLRRWKCKSGSKQAT